MKSNFVVAIDGPAGAGKSTIAKNVAVALKLNYLDTGAMYRAVAWFVLQSNVSPADRSKVSNLLGELSLDIMTASSGVNHIYCNGKNITNEIRDPIVSSAVSQVAENYYVRAFLVKKQRQLGRKGAVVDGRDIGTKVFPDASFKFYLTASMEARVERRWKELYKKGFHSNIQEVKSDLTYRDELDQKRAIGPLKKARDAVLIDTTYMTIEQVTSKIVTYIKQNYREQVR